MSDRDQPKAAQKAGASLMRRVDVAGGAGSSPRRLAESGGTADCRHSEAGYPGNPGSDGNLIVRGSTDGDTAPEFSIQLTALTGIGGYAFFL